MKNTKKLLILISAITVLVATVFSVAVSAVVAGEGTSIDEYTSKKVTAFYNFEDGKTVELVRGAGGIRSITNCRPTTKYVYSDEESNSYFALEYYYNFNENKHGYAEPTVGSLENVEETPANGYVAEFDIAFFSALVLEPATVKYTDANGKEKIVSTYVKEYLYVHELDENNNPKLDENGKYVFVQETDSKGKPLTQPVYQQKSTIDEDDKEVLLYTPIFNASGDVIGAAPDYDMTKIIGEAPVYKKQLDANGQPILVNKTTQGNFDGLGTEQFAVQMQNDPQTQLAGAVSLFGFKTDAASRTITLNISGTNLADVTDKKHVFSADQWLHITIQYDAQTMLTNIYVGRDDSTYTATNGDVIKGRRLVGTVQTQGVNENAGGITVPIYPLTFRLGSSATTGEIGLDNFVGYQGTTIHNPTYLSKKATYERFLHVADALGNEASVATDRYQAYTFLKTDSEMQKVLTNNYFGLKEDNTEIKSSDLSTEILDKISAAKGVYSRYLQDEMDKNNNGIYDALIELVRQENVKTYLEYVALATELPRLISNVETRTLRVTLAENFVANAGSLIDTSHPDYLTGKDRISAIKNTLEGDSAAYEFVRLMQIFDNSVKYGASVARLQAHFDNASAIYGSITKYQVFEGVESSKQSYTDLKAAVESYNSAITVMDNKTKEVNTERFISIVEFMKNNTCGSWANDGENVQDLWYRAYLIIESKQYREDVAGYREARVVFDLAHEYFWNELQKKHVSILTEKLDAYNDPNSSYIDKAGICTYVERYFELNAIDIDESNEALIAIKERNKSYQDQLLTLVGDYRNLLSQNTTKFISVMRKAAEYSSYKDLKPLFDEATSYYYTMNISGEGIEECVEQYAALTKKMSDIERDSGTFVAVVNGTNGYTALESITNKTKLYEALSTCYGCLENLDATYEGVAAAKVIYDAKYAEYTNEINVLNSQVDEASNVAFAARGNWDIDGIVAFVKKLIDMIKE